jgi:uncharacterized membrane protein YhiD involved in acid resistance
MSNITRHLTQFDGSPLLSLALGAASFVVFENLFSTGADLTRMAAQVVSGTGFHGAGIIFREGLNVRGLNTAATLWCSAAVGVLAGGGALPYAAVAAAMVQGLNTGGIHLRRRSLGQCIGANRGETEPRALRHSGSLANRGSHGVAA